MKVNVKTKILTPKVPNFLLVEGKDSIRVGDVDKEDLKEIADAWYQDLLKKWEEQQHEVEG